MHSHHSHSGDYVSHAVDKLDDIVARAHDMGFTHFCLTEHMPRLSDGFLYPEELDKNYTHKDLHRNFANYIEHAQRLQSSTVTPQLLVGFEVEGLDDEHISYAKALLPSFDMCVGLVHYVHSIAIDFSPQLWLDARARTVDNTTRSLYKDYFELQYQVISQLQPHVVGHFDLIRLFEPADEVDSSGKRLGDVVLETDWPEVWHLALRNIRAVAAYGGLFELNSAAIRKGWSTPYPRRDFAEAIIQNGGRFCLSDDSHGLNQVGLNYHKVWQYVKELGLDKVYYLALKNGQTVVESLSVEETDSHPFWDNYKHL